MPLSPRSGLPRFGRHAQRIAAVGGGLVAIGALAGCSATTDDTVTGDSSTGSNASSGIYKDGTYTADGPYVSPGGNVSIGVSITLKDNAITAVTVTPKASDPTSKQYETQFASGISAAVVGKQLDGLSVGAVSGSSLTGKGFETALEAIRKDAAA